MGIVCAKEQSGSHSGEMTAAISARKLLDDRLEARDDDASRVRTSEVTFAIVETGARDRKRKLSLGETSNYYWSRHSLLKSFFMTRLFIESDRSERESSRSYAIESTLLVVVTDFETTMPPFARWKSDMCAGGGPFFVSLFILT